MRASNQFWKGMKNSDQRVRGRLTPYDGKYPHPVLRHGTFFEVDPAPLIRCGVDILMHPYIPVLPAPLRHGLASQSEAGGARPGKNGALRGAG